MKKAIIISLLLVGCTPQEVGEVNIVGKLRAMMMENKTEANINLQDLKNEEHLYAVGAVEGLNGEILVMDSKPLISKVAVDSFSIANTFDAKATLLIYTQVEAWDSIALESDITLKELEDLVNQKSEQSRLTEPIPFLIRGNASTLNWHIVNGSPGTNATHEDHSAAGFNRAWKNVEVEILGFYSESHQGVMTHQGENSHLHFKTQDGSAAGHVDDVQIKKGSLLFMPKSY